MRTMKALVYEKPGRANGHISKIPYPKCKDTQVLIKVLSCGICKPAESSHDKDGSALGVYPAVPGHEFAGVIEEIGSSVTNFQIGDRVTADNAIPCGTCYFCQKGKPAFCLNYKSQGHSAWGGMAQYIVAEESSAFHIPDRLSMNAACLTELVGCCLHCLERSRVEYGDDILILGAGASGMLLAQLFFNSQAGTVTAVDLVPGKLNRLEALGIGTVLATRGDYAVHEQELKRRFPLGFDKVIDTTGDAELMNRTVKFLKKGGCFVGYSFPTTENRKVELDMGEFIVKELTYIGTTFQSFSFQRCLDVMAEGKVDAELIITNEYSLDDYFEALDKNLGDPDSVKVIIHPNEY